MSPSLLKQNLMIWSDCWFNKFCESHDEERGTGSREIIIIFLCTFYYVDIWVQMASLSLPADAATSLQKEE